MDTVGSNPFAVLTAVVAPAILTNASSVLALGTSNRLARVVDRTRVVAKELAGIEPGARIESKIEGEYESLSAQLDRLQVRAQLLVKALRLFYASLGLFATAALLSVVGSMSTYYGQQILFQVMAVLALVAGLIAVLGLALGCALMVHETRLAVRNLAEEAKIQVKYRVGR